MRRGTVIAGRYVVVDEIGRGGMGVVYRVEHAHTGEPLALKVLLDAARFDPQAVARFKREARTSSRIRSEHVVQITDADTAPELDGSPFIVMELLCGTDLEKYAARWGALEPAVLVPLLSQVASVLEIAHGLGIVHRDLKPQNLFLHKRKDGSTITKVLDFGISKFVSAEHALEVAGMTGTGSVLGTPLFMAPEQAHGHNDKIAPSTDIWSMGLVALRLLTGEHYWGAPTMAELMMKIAVAELIPPSERWPKGKRMSPSLDAWFLRSCAREQTMRWPSIQLQLAELASALGVALPSTLQSGLTLPFDVTSPTIPPPRYALTDAELQQPTVRPAPLIPDPAKLKTTERDPVAVVPDGDAIAPAKAAPAEGERRDQPRAPRAGGRLGRVVLLLATIVVVGGVGVVLAARRQDPATTTLPPATPGVHESSPPPPAASAPLAASAPPTEAAQSSVAAPPISAAASSAPPARVEARVPRPTASAVRPTITAVPRSSMTTASAAAPLYAPLAP